MFIRNEQPRKETPIAFFSPLDGIRECSGCELFGPWESFDVAPCDSCLQSELRLASVSSGPRVLEGRLEVGVDSLCGSWQLYHPRD